MVRRNLRRYVLYISLDIYASTEVHIFNRGVTLTFEGVPFSGVLRYKIRNTMDVSLISSFWFCWISKD